MDAFTAFVKLWPPLPEMVLCALSLSMAASFNTGHIGMSIYILEGMTDITLWNMI